MAHDLDRCRRGYYVASKRRDTITHVRGDISSKNGIVCLPAVTAMYQTHNGRKP
jgi:hypothetical protein